MSAGSIQSIIVCTPSNKIASVYPCVDMAGAHTEPTVLQSYVLFPNQGAFIDSLADPLDPVLAGSIWAFAFISVLGLHLLTMSMSHILRLIRG